MYLEIKKLTKCYKKLILESNDSIRTDEKHIKILKS